MYRWWRHISMLVTSQLPIQTIKVVYSFFDVNLCPPTLKKVPPPMLLAKRFIFWFLLNFLLTKFCNFISTFINFQQVNLSMCYFTLYFSGKTFYSSCKSTVIAVRNWAFSWISVITRLTFYRELYLLLAAARFNATCQLKINSKKSSNVTTIRVLIRFFRFFKRLPIILRNLTNPNVLIQLS